MQTMSIIESDGEASLIPDFITKTEATILFNALFNEIAWQTESIIIFGKSINVPRLVAWYGDPHCVYRYSGTKHDPLPWTNTLTKLKVRIEQVTHRSFNSMLANLYRDGNDSMGWHADNEKELGDNPCIASLSLGEERQFRLQHQKTKQNVQLVLQSGSLLIMGGVLQSHWRHSLPKMPDLKNSRINLTFRFIKNST